MKIGYDAKRAFENQTGLGNYSRDLINNYSLSNPKLQILLFAPKIFQKLLNPIRNKAPILSSSFLIIIGITTISFRLHQFLTTGHCH